MCHIYEAAIANNPSIKYLHLDSDSVQRIPNHLIQQISRLCKLKVITINHYLQSLLAPEALNQLLCEQSGSMIEICLLTEPNKSTNDNYILNTLSRKNVSLKKLESFLLCTMYTLYTIYGIPYTITCFPSQREPICFKRFKKLTRLIIDTAILKFLMNHYDFIPTVTYLKLNIKHKFDEQLICKLSKNIKKLFPNLKSLELWNNENYINLNEIEALGKTSEIMNYVCLERIRLKPSPGLIQDFVNAKFIYIKCAMRNRYWEVFPKVQLRNPELVLSNVVNLQILAVAETIKFSEYLDFFRFCPNLKVFNMLVENINRFKKNVFIEEIHNGRIGQKIEEFGLFLPRTILVNDCDLLQSMIICWTNLRIINGIHSIRLSGPLNVSSLNEMAKSLGMETYTNTNSLKDVRMKICFREHY